MVKYYTEVKRSKIYYYVLKLRIRKGVSHRVVMRIK